MDDPLWPVAGWDGHWPNSQCSAEQGILPLHPARPLPPCMPNQGQPPTPSSTLPTYPPNHNCVLLAGCGAPHGPRRDGQAAAAAARR